MTIKTSNNDFNKMESMDILPLLISLALPPMTSMFMQYTYNFLDSMFVSWISEDALTAVSLAFPITTLIISISIGLGVGTNVLISKSLGAKDFDRANSIVSHSIILSMVIGSILTLISFFVVKPYFTAFTDNENILRLGLDYTYIVVLMILPNMVHISIQKIIQSTGNMIAPMLFQMAGVIVNFILDPLLIFGLFGFPELGIKGAAIATVLGYLFSMILAFYVLIFRKQKVSIKTKDFQINYRTFKDIIIIGMPSLIMNALGGFMLIFTNIFLIDFSMTAVAFFGFYYKIQQLIVMTINGLIQGCLPLMSYSYGAKNKDRLMETFKTSLTLGILMMLFGSFLVWIFPDNLLNMFKASDEMIKLGIPALRIMTTSFVFSAFGILYASLFQAIGKTRYSIIINLMRQFLVLLPVMWILSNLYGLDGIWWSFILSEIITTFACFYLYAKEKQDRNSILYNYQRIII